MRFEYILLYEGENQDSGPILPGEAPLNVIATGMTAGLGLAVIWDHFRHRWIFHTDTLSGLAARPWAFRTAVADRATAETEALRFATIPLPSEAELTALCRAARPD